MQIDPSEPDFLPEPLWKVVDKRVSFSTEKRRLSNTPRKFESPADLWEGAKDYFDWSDRNPIMVEKQTSYLGTISRYNTTRVRPYTINEFGIFHGMSVKMLQNIEEIDDPDWQIVCTTIREIIYKQKFDGAISETMNANVITRDLGLAEKRVVENLGGGLKGTLTAEQIAKLSKDARKELLSLFEETDEASEQD